MKNLEYQETVHLLKLMKNNIIRFFKSFKFASRGIAYSVRTQRNIRFHIVAVAFVLILSLFYSLSKKIGRAHV